MKSRLFIIPFFCLLFTNSYAGNPNLKTPGFLGMRATLKYDFGVMMNWDFAGKMPYMHHSAEFGYALTRKHELVLKYSRMDYHGNSELFGYNENYYGSDYYRGLTDEKAQIYSSNEAAVICKFYRNGRGYIAPVGRYFLLGIGYIHSVHKLKFVQEDPYGANIYITQKVTSHDAVVKVGIGRNFIVAKRLMFSIEGMVNLPVTGLFKLIPSIQDGSDSGLGYPNQLIGKVNTNILLKQLVEFKIGFGSLLF